MTTWTQLDALDAPSAGVFDFAAPTLTGATVLQIVCSGITVTTDGTDLKLTFYVAGSEITTGYRWSVRGYASDSTDVAKGTTSAAAVLLVSDTAGQDTGNDTGEGFGCIITVDAPLSTTLHKKVTSEGVFTQPSGSLRGVTTSGLMENTGAITGVKISGTSALTAGKVRLLGLA